MSEQMEFTVKDLVEWIGKQPPDKRYDWTTAGSCLLGQWCKSKGMKGPALRNKSIELGHDDDFYRIALAGYPFTFGAAMDRARSLTLPSEHHS
ncbi:hypothetical protein [Bradyrhizobium sp. 62]|uniref:hypothetical protein n=1 Tax=Bradyrhizobium sp. 62 TaxID=1043588 RepID=UPI001FF892D5|nr:hypothetical protein [Bradyrhizobium sp. 62]MCK1363512.1 hypothetical protein [Bradyrhizobium sp. 62]